LTDCLWIFHKTTAPFVAAVANHCSVRKENFIKKKINQNNFSPFQNVNAIEKTLTINWIPRGIIA